MKKTRTQCIDEYIKKLKEHGYRVKFKSKKLEKNFYDCFPFPVPYRSWVNIEIYKGESLEWSKLIFMNQKDMINENFDYIEDGQNLVENYLFYFLKGHIED